MSILKDIISDIRSVRSRMNVSPSKYSDLVIRCKKNEQKFIKDYLFILKPLARLSNVTMSERLEKPTHSATSISNGMELYIPLEGLVNFDKEKERMGKRSVEIKSLLSNIEGKLSNKNFLQRAPESVIERERSNKDKLSQELEKINKNLEMIQ